MASSTVSARQKATAELDILTSLERGEVISQLSLSQRIAVSVGLINALMKRAIHKGYVKAKAAPYRRYSYYITPKGFSEKGRLVAEYLEHSLSFFRVAREEYAEILGRAHASGARKVAFLGAGELAEIAMLAARDIELIVVCVLDRDTNKDRLSGIAVVRTLDELRGADAVVITDAKAPQAAFDLVRSQFLDREILAPRFMRIARTLPDFSLEVG